MAGRGWGSDQGEDAAIGVSERSLFAPLPASLLPPSPLVPDSGKLPLQTGVTASVPVAGTGRIVRVRRQIGLISLPRLRHSVNT
ncbi:competence protein, partial [Mesorhizobium sp. M7A.F.Ca.CA.001.13.1.1]